MMLSGAFEKTMIGRPDHFLIHAVDLSRSDESQARVQANGGVKKFDPQDKWKIVLAGQFHQIVDDGGSDAEFSKLWQDGDVHDQVLLGGVFEN